jgi:hypothetical protein
MNKEELEKRLAELKNTLEQIQANGNATLGAIRECEIWLARLKEEVAKEKQDSNN